MKQKKIFKVKKPSWIVILQQVGLLVLAFYTLFIEHNNVEALLWLSLSFGLQISERVNTTIKELEDYLSGDHNKL